MKKSKTKVKVVHQKIVTAGNVIEIIAYEKPVLMGFSQAANHDKTRNENMAKSQRRLLDQDNRRRSLHRSKQNITRLINANLGRHGQQDKFVTLTFKENIVDHHIANAEFRKFIKRLNYKLFKKQSGLLYVTVAERQERGAIHFHCVFFNLPYIQHAELLKIWNKTQVNGAVNVQAIEKGGNIGAYLVKYIQKDFLAARFAEGNLLSQKEKGENLYFRSANLLKPTETSLSEEKMQKILGELALNEAYEMRYFEQENTHRGKVSYWQFVPKSNPTFD